MTQSDSNQFEVNLNTYSGPLDVLLDLAKSQKVNLENISVTKLADQFHDFITKVKNLNLELAYDDKDKAGLEDEWYAKIHFVYPPKEGATAQDGISDTMWREEKDMTGQLLTKVKRQNKIMIEFKGNSKITRTD